MEKLTDYLKINEIFDNESKDINYYKAFTTICSYIDCSMNSGKAPASRDAAQLIAYLYKQVLEYLGTSHEEEEINKFIYQLPRQKELGYYMYLPKVIMDKLPDTFKRKDSETIIY